MGTNRKKTGFPDGSDGKESACNAGDPGSIPGLEGNGNPLQYSCLENSMDRGAKSKKEEAKRKKAYIRSAQK